ncbi:MAG: hypothetical protein ACON4I_00975 [Candidatus Puniceispirillaceae bacterium]
MSITSAVTPLPSAAAPLPGGYGIQSAAIGANAVPNLRQTANGLLPAESTKTMHRQLPHQPAMIASPRLAPSAVSAEQALQSRALLTPEFKQNMMATRILRTSNLHAETPRFRNQLDILA